MTSKVFRSFVVTTREFSAPANSPYFTVLAKNGFVPSHGEFVTDSVGDNVAHLGQTWAEMTAMYWVWKNVTGVDVVSFPHFRRYFWCFPSGPYFQGENFHIEPSEDNMAALTSKANVEEMLNILKYSDCIVPRRRYFPMTVAEQYKRCQLPDWELFCKGIALLGKEFEEALPWFDQSNSMHCYNMFVMPWKEFDEYMKILCTLLNWLTGQRNYDKKIPAYLAERFLTIYLHVKGLRKFEVPVALLEPTAT